MAESSQSTNLDWSVHPHAIPPEDGDDSEAMKVARPVEVTLKVAFLSNPVQDFDDRTSAATLSYGIEYEWLDPRLAGWVPPRRGSAAGWSAVLAAPPVPGG